MPTFTAPQRKLLTSVCNVGPLEAAHVELLLTQIEADQTETVTYLLADAVHQLRANGWIGKKDADYITAAIEARAASANAVISNAAETRKALRRLKSIWPASIIEALVTALCD